MNSSKSKEPIIINLNIGDQLTSISCGHVVLELLKFIAYQRLQIPYSYHWLKQVVNKRKMSENQNKSESFQSERHFRVVSTALENLDFILKGLLQELNSSSSLEEVCIALGSTPVTCREVYRLLLPLSCHKPQCHSSHIASDQKIHRKVFQTLVTSEKLSEIFYNQLPPTNTYVFIKKKLNNHDALLSNDSFVPFTGFRIPRTSKIVVINFRTQSQENIACCNEFQVFGEGLSRGLSNLHIDASSVEIDEDFNEIEPTLFMKWYQSSYVMKGFQDLIVNGGSITNTWHGP